MLKQVQHDKQELTKEKIPRIVKGDLMFGFLQNIPLGKNSLTIIGLFVVLVAIPLTVFLAGQQQELRQRAQTSSCTVEWIVNETPAPNTNMEVKIRGISDSAGPGDYPGGWQHIRLYLDEKGIDNFVGVEQPHPTFVYQNINSGSVGTKVLRFAVNAGAKPCTPNKFINTGSTGTTPTPTPGGGSTSLDLSIRQQLVTNPRNSTRAVEVKIFNTQNQEIRSGNTSATFQTGVFRGQLDLGNTFTTGSYVVKLKVRNTLRRLVENITNITAGQVNTLRETELFSGDIVEDNELNALDYANLVGCLDRNRGTGRFNCPSPHLADLNDDGAIDGQDLNILVFNFSHRKGD